MLIDIQKFLIIRLSSIGDIILTTPLIRALRKKYPNAIIDFIIKERFIDLVKSNPNLNTVISFNEKGGFQELRKLKHLIKNENYDYIIDIHKNFRSYYLRTWLRKTEILKYSKDYVKRTLLVKFGIDRFESVVPVYQKYFGAAETLGVEYDGKGTEINIPSGIRSYINSEIKENGYDPKRPFIILCPGAGFYTKRWMPERFARVGDHFSEKYKALVCVLGNENDSDICKAVIKRMKYPAVNYAGKFSLIEAAGLMTFASLVIANDTGLMHMAQSQKRPVVAIFGSTTRELGYFPFPEGSFVIEKDESCRPCTHNGRDKCPRKHFRCMKDIRSREVINRSEQLYLSGAERLKNNDHDMDNNI
ncbi:lipopolysaccharide heptosyltransferase II [candidate division KSB1 bacterium]